MSEKKGYKCSLESVKSNITLFSERRVFLVKNKGYKYSLESVKSNATLFGERRVF